MMETTVGKIRQWIARWIDYKVEKSLQRKANKQFEKRNNG